MLGTHAEGQAIATQADRIPQSGCPRPSRIAKYEPKNVALLSFSLDFERRMLVLALWEKGDFTRIAQTMRESPYLAHIPPHLREVCVVLAAGFVRLRRHTSDEVGDDLGQVGGEAEVLLHFRSDQSGHAEQIPRRDA